MLWSKNGQIVTLVYIAPNVIQFRAIQSFWRCTQYYRSGWNTYVCCTVTLNLQLHTNITNTLQTSTIVILVQL